MSSPKEEAKKDKELACKAIVEMVSGLLGEHAEKVVNVHKKMDGTLAVSIRLSLKHDDGKLSLNSTITYATEQVKDHASEIVDFDQGTIEFQDDSHAQTH